MNDWHVGQQIVCICNTPYRDSAFPEHCKKLTKGDVYTIREIYVGSKVGFLLVGISTFMFPGETSIEIAFRSTRFRPCRETSIECFEGLLTPLPQHETITA